MNDASSRLEALAANPVAPARRGHARLIHFLRAPKRAIAAAYERLALAPQTLVESTPGAEWLLDNHYIIQRALRLVEDEFPAGFERRLPHFGAGEWAGHPRIYALAHDILLALRLQIEIGAVAERVDEFQRTASLTIAELWALPTVLRIAVLEHLAAAAELTRPERANDAAAAGDADDPGQTMGRCVRSLHTLETADWKAFFERLSAVERILEQDPEAAYAKMDFATRDHYRKTVEEIARGADCAEVAVATATLELARAADTARTRHVGYYLIAAGRARLEAQLQRRPGWRVRLRRLLTSAPTATYIGGSVALACAVELALVTGLAAAGADPTQIALAVLVALIPALTVAISIVNAAITRLLPPSFLPKMDFQGGIPASCRTLVAVPSLLVDTREVDTLCAALEMRFLANQDEQLQFALVTDFADAERETMPADGDLLAHAIARVQALNRRYGRSGHEPFHLLHRPRRWSADELCWSGWERKRGKLVELNRLLLGEAEHGFALHEGSGEALRSIRFVISLDADTELPRNSACRLVETLAHPLNQATFAAPDDTVTAGYTVLQPRVEISPLSADASGFSRAFAGARGIDPYTHAVSDVYQDLFGEGVYVGKGIYEVASFEQSLHGRVPENALLSHDLFEGIQGRAGLVTDVVLFEDFPAHYLAYTRRLHRWVRGDWQLLPWLGRSVPVAGGKRTANRLSLISRWKILDNLRRSLLAPTLMLFLLVAWLLLPGPIWLWTSLALLVLAVPGLADLSGGLAASVRSDAIAGNLRGLLPNAGAALRTWVLEVVFLPHQAAVLCDAIARTLVRLFITRRNLLQWTAAAHMRRLARALTRWSVWREMAAAPCFAVGVAALLWIYHPPALPIAAPLLALWLASPEIALRLSRPRRHPTARPSAAETNELRLLARRTWSFFETYVTPEDQWLPPDHFQEAPRGVVARRTSPTNIGLLLVSTIASYDFGYTFLLGMALRLQNTLDTLARMDRYRGHFLNWYDTANLEPLLPRYVSAVDSGNLVGALVVVQESCDELAGHPPATAAAWDGLADTFGVLREVIEQAAQVSGTAAAPELRRQLEHIASVVDAARDEPRHWARSLAELQTRAVPELDRAVLALDDTLGGTDPALFAELEVWVHQVHQHLERTHRNLEMFVAWLPLLDQAPAIVRALPDAAAAHAAVAEALNAATRVRDYPDRCAAAGRAVAALEAAFTAARPPATELAAAREWSSQLRAAIETSGASAAAILQRLADVRTRVAALIAETDFSLLYDRSRRLLHIGYNVTTAQLDEHHYDLLASEARLASFLAIAKGDVPQSHWIHLGRPIGNVKGSRTLLSWSGTMFEFLMPGLLLREEPDTLLGRTCATAVRAQIDHGARNSVPWGISECGYYRFDQHQNYQYRAFGVSELGFKRGLEDDLVVAPYACVLALRYDLRAVIKNLRRIRQLGAAGRHGYYEAIDFSRARLPSGAEHAIVRSFMAHHQGMMLAALDNFLHGDPLPRRFHANVAVRTAELLLFERPAEQAPIESTRPQAAETARPRRRRLAMAAWDVDPLAARPQLHLLSNGRYTAAVSAAGDGFSHWGARAVTPWNADPTLADSGMQIFLRDRKDRYAWSLAAPARTANATRRAVFHPHMAEFHAREAGISTRLLVTVAADADVEVRRVWLVNERRRRRSLRICSYAEVSLDDPLAHRRHPAFSKMFVESEYLAGKHALLLHRRRKAPEEKPAYLVHMLLLPSSGACAAGWRTDRASFIGRNGDRSSPTAMWEDDRRWADVHGASLDPIVALAADIELPAQGTRQVAMVTALTESRSAALDLVERFRSFGDVDWAFERARSQTESELIALGVDSDHLPVLGRLLTRLLYPQQSPPGDARAANELGQSSLWKFALSGDLPILLVRVGPGDTTPLLHPLLRAQAWWRRRGVMVDLVILNEAASGYSGETDERILRALNVAGAESRLHRPGGVFVIRAGQLSDQERVLLFHAARVVLDGSGPDLEKQVETPPAPVDLPPLATSPIPADAPERLMRPADLQFDNGIGGFSADGREYVIHLEPGQHTPAPWVNVVSNPEFGFVVSESGGGFTWAGNSGENRLTTWHNDPVCDPASEALYLRDEESGDVWSPTPGPAPGGGAYQVRHGAGYTQFHHASHGIEQRVRCFAAMADPVKIVELELVNRSARPRRLTATFYVEWVLGSTRDPHQQFVVAEFDAESETLTARNPWNEASPGAVAFAAASRRLHGFTCDRAEFFGRGGSRARPAALTRIGLANAVRPGLDPCAALQVHVDLPPGGVHRLHFLLGQGAEHSEALRLAREYRAADHVAAALQAVHEHWDRVLGALTVRTPEPALDVMLNRWLPYQVIACRLWGRSGYYQASGAYGFRDQLQDVAALVHLAPDLARRHILEAAAHQFIAGDVLHWWHPPLGTGVRTRCSDDLVWLPFVVARYVEASGDFALLEENLPYLEGDELRADEHERYARFSPGNRSESLYDHCVRALERAHALGSHGLPRFGSGDWNDGMNRVGARGKGESVWLGWFLYATLERFAPLCRRMNESAQGEHFSRRAAGLRRALENTAWDGHWYRRGYYDDGSPLGSAQRDECRIDSLAQSWAVLSGAGDSERSKEAMHAVRRDLIGPSEDLILLFTPPFDRSTQNPGYIKGYPPGIRENGGQYTHAAAWVIWALAELGESDLAMRLFTRLLPTHHASTPERLQRYRVEPYVLAADVGGASPHSGRGGWTWYTGAAGWMYRLGSEVLLGMHQEDQHWRIDPCIPSHWPSFEVTLRDGETVYEIHVDNPDRVNRGVQRLLFDGRELPDNRVPRRTGQPRHRVEVRLGEASVAQAAG